MRAISSSMAYFSSLNHRLRYRFYSAAGLFVDRLTSFVDYSMYFLGPILVLLCWAILAFFFHSYFYHLAPLAGFDPWDFPHCFQTALGLYLLFNMYYNHVMAVFTNPGHPLDSSQISPTELIDPATQLISSTISMCSKCEKPKFSRTHHCSACRKCVLRMDHHCPWIANCVGFYNYRYFYLFLFYLTAGCLYYICLIIPVIMNDKYDSHSSPSTKAVFLTLILSSAAFFSVGGFFLFHTYLIATNQTTIEYYMNSREERKINKRSKMKSDGNSHPHAHGDESLPMEFVNRYDFGFQENFRQLFGSSLISLRWSVAGMARPLGDGMKFPEKIINKQLNGFYEREYMNKLKQIDSSDDRKNISVPGASAGAGTGFAVNSDENEKIEILIQSDSDADQSMKDRTQ